MISLILVSSIAGSCYFKEEKNPELPYFSGLHQTCKFIDKPTCVIPKNSPNHIWFADTQRQIKHMALYLIQSKQIIFS